MSVELQVTWKRLSDVPTGGNYEYPNGIINERAKMLLIVSVVVDDGSYVPETRPGSLNVTQSVYIGRRDETGIYAEHYEHNYPFTSPMNTNKLSGAPMTFELFRTTVDLHPGYYSYAYGIITVSAQYDSGTSSGIITYNEVLGSDSFNSDFESYRALRDIPFGSSVKALNGVDLGVPHAISVYKPENLYLKVKYSCTGNESSTTGWILGDENNYASPDGIEPFYKEQIVGAEWIPSLELARHYPTSNQVNVTFTTYTYDSNHTLQSIDYDTRVFILPDEYGPTCDLIVSDSLGYYDKYGAFIAGKSKYRVDVNAQGIYGSTIEKIYTTANGEIHTTDSFVTNVLVNTGTMEINTTVRDSRGRIVTDKETAQVIDYSVPNVNDISTIRCNSDGSSNKNGDYVKAMFSASVSPLNNRNHCLYVVKYKKTSENISEYVEVPLPDYSDDYILRDAVCIFPAELGTSYNVLVEITDDFTTRYRSTISSSGSKILSFLNRGTGLAIGKVAELADHLDIGWATRFRKGVILDNSQAIWGGANTWAEPIGMLQLDSNDCTVLSGAKININAPSGVYINDTLVSRTVDTPAANTLWSGAWFMNEHQTATLSESTSKQLHGIVLVWSYYQDSVVQDVDFQTTYIPKDLITLNTNANANTEISVLLKSASQGYMGSKRLIIQDTQILGHSINERGETESTAGGYKDTANRFVLRYVIGV